MKLTDRALLVQLSISQWTARKFDKKTTKEVADSHGVTEVVGRYNKALLPLNDLLRQIHQTSAAIRQRFYANTLPWGIEGTFILPTGNYLEFMTEFRGYKSKWLALVDDFCNQYPAIKLEAQQILGSMYDPKDYPDDDRIRDKFDIDMAVFPVPSNDFRVELADDELSRIQKDIEARVQNSAQLAMRDAWDRLYEKVTHIAGKLADPKAIFRDSTIENARELCDVLTRLNFTDDPNLEAMRTEVEQQLVSHHPDALRNDPILRQDMAAKARDIANRMDIFMTGVQQ